ncbi:MAG: hypothetical protein ACK4HV_02385 [Parachlamydiaceae bacterium]
MCREWNAYLKDVDFRIEANLIESPSSFCFFNLSRIPQYRDLRCDFDGSVKRRKVVNLLLQPELLVYPAMIALMLFFYRAYRRDLSAMYAPSMDEQRVKLAYFIGQHATNERIISYLKGEMWALRFLALGGPGLFSSVSCLASTGSLISKKENQFKLAEASAKTDLRERLLLPERYSSIDELKPYIDPETKRVMHIPVELKDGSLRDLVSLVDLPGSKFKNYWLQNGYEKAVFRKDIYDLIQKRIKQG